MLKNAFLAVTVVSTAIAAVAAPAPKIPSAPTIPDDAAIKRASDIATGNPSKCPGGTKFFPQPLDHATFGGNYADLNSTFLQQYILDDTYYKPGGPILFNQGGETTMACIEETTLPEWAQEIGALIVSLEHRYFGISVPYGLNYTEHASWDPKLLKPLSIENALSDSVSFITWVKNVGVTTAKDAKVIAFGGSYSGTLVTRLRTHYPDVFFGTIASSPVTKTVSDPADPMVYAATDWSNMVINDMSYPAAVKIKDSFTDLRARMTAGNFSGIQEALNLCTAPRSTNQTDQLISIIEYSYSIAAQFNGWSNGYPLNTILNDTLQLNSSLPILGAATKLITPVLSILWSTDDKQCLSWELGVQDEIDPYSYILCTSLPFLHYSYARAETIFGAITPDLSFDNINNPWCRKTFGIDAIDGGEAYDKAHLTDDYTLEHTERLLISEGLADLTTAYGPRPWLPGSGRQHSRVIYITEGDHVSDVGRPNATNDLRAVTQARTFEINSVKEWLACDE